MSKEKDKNVVGIDIPFKIQRVQIYIFLIIKQKKIFWLKLIL